VKRAEGKSTRVIAEELGVPQKTVARDSTESVDSPENVTGKDGKKRPANKVPAWEKAKRRHRAAALRHEGKTQAEIADTLGVSVGNSSR